MSPITSVYYLDMFLRALKLNCGTFNDVSYVVEQNVQISSACGNHTPYVRHLSKNTVKRL